MLKQSKAVQPSEHEEKNDLVPLFYTSSLQTVKYRAQLGEKAKEISTAELGRKLNFQWIDRVLAPMAQRDAMWKANGSPNNFVSGLHDRLHHPVRDIEICFINEDVGHGALSPQVDPPKLNTLVGIYAGIFSSQLLNKQSETHYDWNLSLSEKDLSAHFKIFGTFKPFIRASKFGNITRFFQDLPSEDEIAQVKNLTELEKSNIATANIGTLKTYINGWPIVLFFTLRDISSNEPYGYTYGNDFDFHKRFVFNKRHEVIGYFNKVNEITFVNYKATPEMACARRGKAYDPEEKLDFKINEPLSSQKFFLTSVNFAIDLFAKRISPKSYLGKGIEILKTYFHEQADPKSSYTSFQKFLGGLDTSQITETEYEILEIFVKEIDRYRLLCIHMEEIAPKVVSVSAIKTSAQFFPNLSLKQQQELHHKKGLELYKLNDFMGACIAFEDALKVAKVLLDLHKNLNGVQQQEMAQIHYNLGSAYFKIPTLDRSEQHLLEAVKLSAEANGAGNEKTIKAKARLQEILTAKATLPKPSF